jgi:hypothetical protein
MANLLNVIDFVVPISVRYELLGTRWSLDLGAQQAELCLPTSRYDASAGQFLYEAPSVRGVRFLDRWLKAWSDDPWDMTWATPAEWTPGVSNSLVSSLHAAVLRVSVASTSRTAQRQRIIESMAEGVGKWYETFSDWIEVLTEQDLDWQHPLQRAAAGAKILRHDYWAQPVAGRYELLSPKQIKAVTVVSGAPAASRSSWSSAVRGANRQQGPSDAWVLIRDARNALHRKLFRRSVLDAATAAELVLSTAIARCLQRTHPPQLVQHTLDQARELGRKSRLACKLGVPLPRRMQEDLINVRNRTIHANSTPNRAQAKTAFDIASRLVSQEEPL